MERWINIPYSRGMIHFFHPGLFKRAGVSTFMWQGDEDQRSVFNCEPIARTALDLGIITSLNLCIAPIADWSKWLSCDGSFDPQISPPPRDLQRQGLLWSNLKSLLIPVSEASTIA